jgi:hypothetical protein
LLLQPESSLLPVLQIVQAFQHGLFECDALVGVGVIGRQMDGGDVGCAGFVKSLHESVVGGSEAVVGGNDEYRAGCELRGEVGDVPRCCVRDDLLGEALGRATGQGRHAFGGEVGGETGRGFFLLSGLEGLHPVDTHVGCGDQADGSNGGILRSGVAGHESAHAVADKNDVGGVGSELFRVGSVAQIGDGGLRVFNRVGEGEVAGGAPGAAVVEVEDVPAVAADGLGEVEILFVAGEAVKKKDDRVRACSFRDVSEGVEHGPVAGNLEGFHGGGIGLVGWWILIECGDCVSSRLGMEGQRGSEEGGNDKELT